MDRLHGVALVSILLNSTGATATVWYTTMSWIWHGARKYYYRSIRTGSCVTKEYIGTGLRAERCADADAQQCRRRQAEADAWRQARADMEALDAQIQAWWDAGSTLVNASLTAAGYYQHARGAWRKRALPRGDAQAHGEGRPG